MKVRLLVLLLVMVLLFTACTPSNLGGTETTAPSTTSPTQTTTTTAPTQPTEPPIPTPEEVIDGTYSVCGEEPIYKDPERLIGDFFNNYFLKDETENNSIEILHTTSDGTESTIKVVYNGSNKYFRYTEGDVSQTYDYIVYAPISGQPEDDFDYLHIMLLSNKPDATYLDTLDQENPEAVIVYARFVTLEDSVESYGDIPTIVQLEDALFSEISSMVCFKNSYFMVDRRVDSLPIRLKDFTTIYRFDYNGNLICSVELPCSSSDVAFCEVSDGGCIICYRDIDTREFSLARYDANGDMLWTQEIPMYYPLYVQIANNTIYCFGHNEDHNITVTKFTPDGELIGEEIILKGHYGSFYVAPEEDGFGIYMNNIYGDEDSDIPYGKYYIQIDFELNITSCIELDESSPYGAGVATGYLDGKPVFGGDPIFEYHPSENLPENPDVYPRQDIINHTDIFEYQEGYIIVRQHKMGRCYIADSNYPHYYENIFTYYDSTGTPQWQYVSPIRIV